MAPSAKDVRTPPSVRGQTSAGDVPLDPGVAVSWIMNPEVVAVRPDMLLTSLESLLVSQDLSRVPVIDKAGELVGVISKTDLITHHLDQVEDAERPTMRTRPPIPPGFHPDVETGDTVADVMCQTVLSVTPETTIARAAELMAVHQVHGLPVVGNDRKVIGWLSTLDVLSWVAGLGR